MRVNSVSARLPPNVNLWKNCGFEYDVLALIYAIWLGVSLKL